MKKIIYILLAISLFHYYADAQWVQQISGVNTSLLDIDFVNENTGWACGDDGVVVKTTNGGMNWVQQNTGLFKRLEGIDAVDANIIYSVGWFQTIIKSTNGGSNWMIIRDGPTGVGSTFFKCFFINVNTGWLLRSGGGYVLKTTNGGISFDSVITNNSFNRDIYFKDANTGVICGDGAWVIRSTDGGISWVQIPLPLLTGAPNLYRMSFVGNTGWTIGEGSESGLGKLVFKTTDFGITWDSIARVSYPNNTLNYSVYFVNQNTGYCGGTFGHIFKSTNGGFNWIQQNVPINGFRNDFWFANDSTRWVVGGGGFILKTTNGGTYVGINLISTEIPVNFDLLQNYPNPFNNETIIKFIIGTDGLYTFEIYDILGRKVEEVFKQSIEAGTYQLAYNAGKLSSGIYLYILSSEMEKATRKFILIK